MAVHGVNPNVNRLKKSPAIFFGWYGPDFV